MPEINPPADLLALASAEKLTLSASWESGMRGKAAMKPKYLHLNGWLAQPDATQAVVDALARSLTYCRAHLDDISEYAARWESFPADRFRSYFDALQFRFDPRYRPAQCAGKAAARVAENAGHWHHGRRHCA